MRGTFYFRSRTFYHHLSEMRKNLSEGPQELGADRQAGQIQPADSHGPETSTKGVPADPSSNSIDPEDRAACAANLETNFIEKSNNTSGHHGIMDGKSYNDHDQLGGKQISGSDEEDPSSSLLLPGLPNEMTIEHILTRVPWSALFVTLPAVSSAWLRAIRNLQVHNARIRTKTSQTLVAIIHQTLVRKSVELCPENRPNKPDEFEHALAISLYDPPRDQWYLLPSIEGVDRGIPYACECVCLEGKVYIFGGYGNFCPTNAVYVLDLAAGIGVWRQCASMKSARVGFSGGAKNGKVYIFGGTRSGPFEISSACLEAEVFDPEKNSWASIAPTLHRHTSHCVACIGGEFIIHGGRCWTDVDSDDSDGDNRLHDSSRIAGRVAEVYNPCKNEWHEVKNFAVGIVGASVVVDGKLHIISERDSCVYVYDKQSNSWTASQGISWQGLRFESSPASNVVIEATAWEGEILAAMCSWNVARFRSGLEDWEDQIVLLKSKGLGTTDTDLEWERIASADEFHKQILCMRFIQL